MNLFEHSTDCSPLTPCAACELVAWLRGRLDPKDFTELVNCAKGLNPPKRTYRRRRRDGHETNEQPPEAAGLNL